VSDGSRQVYVLIAGCHETTYPAAVYVSAEAAMADNPPAQPKKVGAHGSAERLGGWQEDGYRPGVWTNGLDWDESAEIVPFVVQDGPA
jgi:hypothetical protein